MALTSGDYLCAYRAFCMSTGFTNAMARFFVLVLDRMDRERESCAISDREVAKCLGISADAARRARRHVVARGMLLSPAKGIYTAHTALWRELAKERDAKARALTEEGLL